MASVAADKKGKILLFNDAASEIRGYSEEEALPTLDIRDVYPDDGAYKIMENLRSDQYGGPGKLKSYQIDVFAQRRHPDSHQFKCRHCL